MIPFPLIHFIQQDRFRPTRTAFKDAAEHGTIAHRERVRIAIHVIVDAAIDVNYRVHAIGQLFGDKAVQIVCVYGFIDLVVCYILKG